MGPFSLASALPNQVGLVVFLPDLECIKIPPFSARFCLYTASFDVQTTLALAQISVQRRGSKLGLLLLISIAQENKTWMVSVQGLEHQANNLATRYLNHKQRTQVRNYLKSNVLHDTCSNSINSQSVRTWGDSSASTLCRSRIYKGAIAHNVYRKTAVHCVFTGGWYNRSHWSRNYRSDRGTHAS